MCSGATRSEYSSQSYQPQPDATTDNSARNRRIPRTRPDGTLGASAGRIGACRSADRSTVRQAVLGVVLLCAVVAMAGEYAYRCGGERTGCHAGITVSSADHQQFVSKIEVRELVY